MPSCVLRDLATQLLALLAVFVLLASALGPMLDHHFAERHPAHGHLYMGAVGLDHSHPFENSHIHYDELYAPVSADDNVVFFAPYDGSGHPHSDVATPVVLSYPRFGDDQGPLLSDGAYKAAFLRGVTVSPLLQPPKA